MAFEDDFVRVSTELPCPVCGKPDWCVISRTGSYVLCQRTASVTYCGEEAGYYHRLKHPVQFDSISPLVCKPKLSSEHIEELHRKSIEHCLSRRVQLAKQLNLKVDALSRLDVGWDGKRWVFPMDDGYGNTIGLRYRYPSGKKMSLRGGRSGIFIPWKFDPQPTDYVFITEGPTDCAALLGLNLWAVGKPNNMGGANYLKNLLNRRKIQGIVTVADNDVPGILGAVSTAKHFPGAVIVSPRIGKDARECCKHQTTSESIIDCINGHHSLHWERLDAHTNKP